jgi:hypothetical protein
VTGGNCWFAAPDIDMELKKADWKAGMTGGAQKVQIVNQGRYANLLFSSDALGASAGGFFSVA